MANKTLLNGVNDVLKKVRLIAGDSAVLTTLTDSARQSAIDVAIQTWNEAIDELYSTTGESRLAGSAEDTVTLATGTRAYSLNSALVRLHWPLIDKTNNQFIQEYDGGYEGLLILDPEQDDTGLPLAGVIRPTDGKLHLDRAPTSAENGRIYTYQYDKDVSVSAAADTMPFGNPVYRAMVPAVAELWKREMRQEFDTGMARLQIARAGRLLTQKPQSSSWNPRC